MIQYLYENNIIIYIFAGLCGLGVFVRFILDLVYLYLVKESDNLAATKNKTLQLIKKKFETCYKLKIGVNNVDTFVDKNLIRYRLCGILLSTWENFSGQVLLLSFLIVPVGSIFGVIFEVGQDRILSTGAVGVLTGAVLIFVDKMMNLPSKKHTIRLNLLDFLENFCKVRMEQETADPEFLEKYRREYLQAAEARKQVSASAAVKEKQEDEINRRQEARKRKEEERKQNALKREEEQRKIELARKEEERIKLEERKKAAAKRREEELLRLEEEREALELRRAELRKKAEEKKIQGEKKLVKKEEKEKILSSIEEEIKAAKKEEEKQVLKSLEEIAAEKEKEEKQSKKQDGNRSKSRIMTPEEEKLVEDVLREFFA